MVQYLSVHRLHFPALKVFFPRPPCILYMCEKFAAKYQFGRQTSFLLASSVGRIGNAACSQTPSSFLCKFLELHCAPEKSRQTLTLSFCSSDVWQSKNQANFQKAYSNKWLFSICYLDGHKMLIFMLQSLCYSVVCHVEINSNSVGLHRGKGAKLMALCYFVFFQWRQRPTVENISFFTLLNNYAKWF